MASINPFLPIQEGTGTPSPDNIRPILPAVSIAGGKNLLYMSSNNTIFSSAKNSNITSISNGSFSWNNTVNGGFIIPCMPNTTYTYSFNYTDSNSGYYMRVWGCSEYPTEYTKLSVIIEQSYAIVGNVATFTTGVDIHWLVVGAFIYSTAASNGGEAENLQLEEGSTATAYEPYQSLDVYGGSIDIVNNTITEEYSIIDKPWSEWILHGNQTNTTRKYLEHTSEVYQSGEWSYYISMCNVTTFSFSWSENDNPHFYHSTHTRAFVWLPNDYDETVQVQVLGRLCTPIIHTLTPTQLAQAMDQLGIRLSSTLIDARRKIILNSPHLEIISNRVASFNTDMKAPLKDCKISFVPVQEGSGNASPTNIRPITGWTGINVEHKGKNLYDVSSYPFSTGRWIHGYTGVSGSNASFKCTMDFIPLIGLDGKTITLNKKPGGSNPGIAFYSNDSTNNFISGVKNDSIPSDVQSMTVTVPNGTKYMRFTVPADATDIQIELGNTATEYEDYNGTTIPISWESDLGTIYGGYIDLVNGTLVQEWVCETANNNGWTKASTDGVTYTNPYQWGHSECAPLSQNRINQGGWYYCTHWTTTSFDFKNSAYINENGALRMPQQMWEALGIVPTSDNIIKFLADQAEAGTPFYVCCKLLTPIVHQLTPQQIKTLIGQNNILTNANSVTDIKFWTH